MSRHTCHGSDAVCVVHTERASVFVLQFPSLVETCLGRRLLLHPALTGHFGRTLGAEVSGDVTRQPPLRGKCSIAAPHHALQEHIRFIRSVDAEFSLSVSGGEC